MTANDTTSDDVANASPRLWESFVKRTRNGFGKIRTIRNISLYGSLQGETLRHRSRSGHGQRLPRRIYIHLEYHAQGLLLLMRLLEASPANGIMM